MLAIGFGPSVTVRGSPPIGFDFGAGVLPAGAALTRATAGSRFDAAGVLRIEAPDVARFDHDPASGALLGLLIEPRRTNEATMSAAIDDDDAWAKNGEAPVASNVAMAPDGSTTAASVSDPSGTSFSALARSMSSDARRALSVFVAKDAIGRETRFVLFRGRNPLNVEVAFDTSTGEFYANGAVNPRARDCGAFWRLAFDCEACNVIQYFPAVGASAAWAISPDTTGFVVLWGFQAEQGAGASSYIPAGASPATRAADVLTLDWGRLGAADGALGVRYVFDDGSSEDGEAEVIDGHASVPTTLARPWIRRIERR